MTDLRSSAAELAATALRTVREAYPYDLRVLYEQQMAKILDFKIGHPKGVGFNKKPLYHLIFGSKSQFGMNLWNGVNRKNAFEQDELWLGGA